MYTFKLGILNNVKENEINKRQIWNKLKSDNENDVL